MLPQKILIGIIIAALLFVTTGEVFAGLKVFGGKITAVVNLIGIGPNLLKVKGPPNSVVLSGGGLIGHCGKGKTVLGWGLKAKYGGIVAILGICL